MNSTPRSWLDYLSLAVIAFSVLFLGLVILRGPFARGLLFGAVFAAIYGYQTKQDDLVKIAIFAPLIYALAWGPGAYLVFKLTPHTIDRSLLQADAGIGVGVWHWCASRPWAMNILHPVYYGLGFVLSIGMCFTDRRGALVRAVAISAALGFLCYYLFPACGPRYLDEAVAARNCMPSLHFTWALLFWIYADKYAKWPLFMFAVLTGLATMATGEHYFIDLVAAVPFTALVCALSVLVERPDSIRKTLLPAEVVRND